MKPFLFLSHSSRDTTLVKAVCHQLEDRGIRCWMAPRDILPGSEWSAQITAAIRDSSAFLLVLSVHSNQSKQVLNEVVLASRNAVPILPFRVEDVNPSDALDYFTSTHHWLDAVSPPLQEHVDRLGEAVETLFRLKSPGTSDSADSAANAPVIQDEPTVEATDAERSVKGLRRRRPVPAWGVAVAVLALASLSFSIWSALTTTRQSPTATDAIAESHLRSEQVKDSPPLIDPIHNAGDWKTDAPRRALVIGVADYEKVNKLANPLNDARLMRRTLESCGFNVRQVDNPDLGTLTDAVSAFCEAGHWQDHALIYFSGQGAMLNGKDYVMPVDTDPTNGASLVQSALLVDQVTALMTKNISGMKMLVLDCCRDELAQTHRGVVVVRVGSKSDLLVVRAAAAGGQAVDGPAGGNSPFCQALCRAILVPGLGIEDALQNVIRDTRTATEGMQRPEFTSTLEHPFVFTKE